MDKISQRNPFKFTLMHMQVIWKIKHQKSKFSRQENLCTKSYYQLMGFVQLPSDLFTKFTPWCFDDYIMWSEPEPTVPALALFPICQVLPLWFPQDAGRHISMYAWLTAKNDIYIFSEICFKNSWIFSSFTLLSLCYPLPLACLSLSLFFLIPSSLLPLSLFIFIFFFLWSFSSF